MRFLKLFDERGDETLIAEKFNRLAANAKKQFRLGRKGRVARYGSYGIE